LNVDVELVHVLQTPFDIEHLTNGFGQTPIDIDPRLKTPPSMSQFCGRLPRNQKRPQLVIFDVIPSAFTLDYMGIGIDSGHELPPAI
jgi:hypothetical protein